MSTKSSKTLPHRLRQTDPEAVVWSLCTWHYMMGLHWVPRVSSSSISPCRTQSESPAKVLNPEDLPNELHSSELPIISPEKKAQEDRSKVWDQVSDEDLESALEKLKESYTSFEESPLKAMAQTTVFSDGNPRAKVMLIGEAPGAEEDRLGLPFVGASGQLLDKMLASIGLDRTQVYITNLVPWRPPGNRPPTPQEIQLFKPFLMRHIALIRPRYLVVLGATACKAVCGSNLPMARWRGRWFPLPEVKFNVQVRVFFHPSYLLRSPYQKREAWKDLLALKDVLNPDSPSFQAVLG